MINTILQASDNFNILNNENTKFSYDIIFTDDSDNTVINKHLSDLKKNDDMIIKYTSLQGFNNIGETTAIYFNDKYDINYNLLEGRFFIPEDFDVNENKVVIGKKLLNKTITENGKKYLTNGATKYEIIGVIGYENYNTPLDTMIIYNLDSILNSSNPLWTTSWVISSNSNNSYVESYFNNSGIKYSKPQSTSANPIQMSIAQNSDLAITTAFIILGILITFFTCLTHWFNSLKQEIGVRKSFGASENDIFKDIFIRYILLTFIASVLAVILQLLASKLGLLSYNINLLGILPCSSFLILFGLVFLFILIYKLKSVKVQYLLKE
ncbi:ABC transporter permease [Clostridium sp.]|uniref:ABC transporter permease n=1 Tax=Clostridium sp. TaxID=1506 RepID=UPI003F6818C8